MNKTFDRVKSLCTENDLSLNQLENILSLGKNSLYGLKKGNPNSKVLNEIAEYFNVSIDYLLGRTEIKNFKKKQNTVDIEALTDTVLCFDGKPLTDDEKITIQGIINGYLNTRK